MQMMIYQNASLIIPYTAYSATQQLANDTTSLTAPYGFPHSSITGH